jgi:hypothetical protein
VLPNLNIISVEKLEQVKAKSIITDIPEANCVPASQSEAVMEKTEFKIWIMYCRFCAL